MDHTDNIIQELNGRFARPLPDFFNRRIIFWYDEDKEFEDTISEIKLSNAKVVRLTGRNNFEIKKLLSHDDTNSNYCVYCPVSYPDVENWLLPIQLYSETFRADLISMWLDEMGIKNTKSLRTAVKNHRQFFKAKARRTKMAAFGARIERPVQLYKALIAVLCKVKNTSAHLLIRTVLCAGVDEQNNTVYQSIAHYGADTIFWEMARQLCGYCDDEPHLKSLAACLLLTAAARTMRMDATVGLSGPISLEHALRCYDFVSEWMRSDQTQELFDIARDIEDELDLYTRFMKRSVEELMDTEMFPCVNECILSKIMTDISNHIINADQIKTLASKRRTCLWYDQVQYFYEGILEMAHMQEFYQAHSAGFHTVLASKVYKEYVDDYYQMDTYYRHFHVAFNKSLNTSNPRLDDLFKHIADIAEGMYVMWFLEELGDNWSRACEDNLACYGRILEVPQQRDFYCSKVKVEQNRVFVIISDAMRYEVAVSLADELRRETRADVKLDACAGIFPTITKFGMAALLPNKKLTAQLKSNGEIAVLADDTPTDAAYRDAILKRENPKSVALRFEDIIKMNRADRSAKVKGIDVVYIYHNRIDETGHSDETRVFDACEHTIAELKNMVKIIVHDLYGTKIYLTSDHGFLYTYKPLSEDSKVDKTTKSAQDVEVGRRYLITKKGAQPKHMLPVKFMDDTHFDCFAALGNTRIKKQGGGGMNFVHGGMSLQEMVVPIIFYHYMRAGSAEYEKNKKKYDTKPVTVELLSANHKVSNMSFSLDFYQKEAIGDNRKAATYLVYFTDSENRKVSDEQTIIADKASKNNQERRVRVSFNLKSQKYDNKENYYLVIADQSGEMLPQRVEFTIDLACALDDFDFFS